MSVVLFTVGAVGLAGFVGIYFCRGLEAWVSRTDYDPSWWVIGSAMLAFLAALILSARVRSLDAGAHPVLTSKWVLLMIPATLGGVSYQAWSRITGRERS